jgi:catechol 2,3-dioxygenase-like lactoylglutathione lyase family enzyme
MSETTDRFGLGAIGQIALNARDLERAIGFYRDTLGMRFLFQVPGMAFFDCGGIRLLIGPPSAPEFDHPASILYYRVDDIHAAQKALEARGVRFKEAPHLVAKMPGHDLWIGFFPDPEGNVLALMSEVPTGA